MCVCNVELIEQLQEMNDPCVCVCNVELIEQLQEMNDRFTEKHSRVQIKV